MKKTMTPLRSILATAAVVLIASCGSGHHKKHHGDVSEAKSKMQDARPGMPNISEMAANLGVTEETLKEALSKAGGPPPDMKKLAAELGISEEKLKEAMPKRP